MSDRSALPEELGTASSLAALLGLTPAAVSNWQARALDFPAPWGEWGGVKLFLVADVVAWYDGRTRTSRAQLEQRAEALRAQLARLDARLVVHAPGCNLDEDCTCGSPEGVSE